jgi:uncharacterized membrane protein YkvA (DUF1232 family)
MTGKDIAVVDPAKYARDRERVNDGFWRKIRRHAGRVPFLDEALAAYYCSVDPRTPLSAKAVLMGALAYFIVPTDLLPDFIAWLGFTDDAAVLYAAVKSVKPHIKDSHRERARAWLEKRDDTTADAA